jgi:hypothetical protein
MFEILEIQKIIESRARVTLIPEKSSILPELLASGARASEAPAPPPPRPKAGAAGSS